MQPAVAPLRRAKRAKPVNAPTPDAELILDACSKGAAAARPLFSIFLLFGTYLAATLSGVTHLALFYGVNFKLPIVDLSLPLQPFFALAPCIFFLLHVWLLLHAALVSENVHLLKRLLRAQPAATREVYWQRLENFTLIHALALDEVTPFRLLLDLVNFVTLVVFPLGILLLAQMVFLPYHSLVTWEHRLLVLADVLLLSYVWPIIVRGRPRGLLPWLHVMLPALLPGALLFPVLAALKRWRARPLPGWLAEAARPRTAALGLLLAASLALSALVATYPGDGFDRLLYPSPPEAARRAGAAAVLGQVLELRRSAERSRVLLREPTNATSMLSYLLDIITASYTGTRFLHHDSNEVWGLPFFKRNLVLDGEFISPASRASFLQGETAHEAAPDGEAKTAPRHPAIDISDRDFSHASLRNAELADLSFVRVNLQDARFTGATLDRVRVATSSAPRADFTSATLRNTSVIFSNLAGAVFNMATLDGTSFNVTRLGGSSFADTDFKFAEFRGAGGVFAPVSLVATDLSASVITSLHGGTVLFDHVDLSLADVLLGDDTSKANGGIALAALRNVNLSGASLSLFTRAAVCSAWEPRSLSHAYVSASACGKPIEANRLSELGEAAKLLDKERGKGNTPAFNVELATLASLGVELPHTASEMLTSASTGSSESPASLLWRPCTLAGPPCDGYESDLTQVSHLERVDHLVQLLCQSIDNRSQAMRPIARLMREFVNSNFDDPVSDDEVTRAIEALPAAQREGLLKDMGELQIGLRTGHDFRPDLTSLVQASLMRIEGEARLTLASRPLAITAPLLEERVAQGLSACFGREAAQAAAKSVLAAAQ